MQPGLHWSKTKAAHYELVAPHIHPNLVDHNAARFFWNFLFSRRRTFTGEVYEPPAPGPDEAWFYDTSETFSEDAANSQDALTQTGGAAAERTGSEAAA